MDERQMNQSAFRLLESSIAQTYPHGRFVAIVKGAIVADAERFEELLSKVVALGQTPSRALIVQAGVEYPERAMIFAVTA